MARVWISIDTGGTFTDMAVIQSESGHCYCYKVPTRTEDPAKGILEGIKELLRLAEVRVNDVDFVVLGTTLATNAVLEKTWARTGMLTTRGFRDVLDLARQRRPHYFNLDLQKPQPPALRPDRCELTERLAYDGTVVEPLDLQELDMAIDYLRTQGVGAVAVCFMHAYQNAEHERIAVNRVREALPEIYVCASSDVLREFREYERFSTTVVNASLMPLMDVYLDRFEKGVSDFGISAAPRVMQSNGGAVTTATVRRLPVNTFFSGPAGGIVAAMRMGEKLGQNNLITFDMGGTSTDVCLIKEGLPARKNERSMGGLPVRARILDIHTIGAGGGSLAWTDVGGLLKVGPRSAGAVPGPAAYGRGGDLPTVTDANVALGRLNPTCVLNGRMEIFAEKAKQAILTRLCAPLGLDLTHAAMGVLRIANTHMTSAVRVISVEQGEDPRDYSLVAFGGAGPLHAADVALLAGIRHVIVPPRPGIFSAQGLLEADQRADFSLTRLLRAEPGNVPQLMEGLKELQTSVDEWVRGEEVSDVKQLELSWQLDLRYTGQNSELIIPLESTSLDKACLESLIERFHERHRLTYGYDIQGQAVEIVTLRVAVAIHRDRLATMIWKDLEEIVESGPGSRAVWFPGCGFIETPVLRRERLEAGTLMRGPMIIEQMDTTLVVPPEAAVRVDSLGYIHLDLNDVTLYTEDAL